MATPATPMPTPAATDGHTRSHQPPPPHCETHACPYEPHSLPCTPSPGAQSMVGLDENAIGMTSRMDKVIDD
eukprot:4822147-Prymnesium_polylepis.1